MRINYNVSAMLSNNALSNSDDLLSKSIQRLSSGLKINNAKDNPAGLAMGKRMNAQLRGLDVANQNASDGVSVIEIADGALSEVHDMLQRMNELAVKAANGTMTTNDREMVQAEIAQLKEEITRISDTTEFNGQPLLNGEFEMKGYVTNNGTPGNVDIKVNSYSEDVPVKEYKINSLTLSNPDANGNYTEVAISYDETTFTNATSLTEEIKDGLVTIKGDNGFEMTLDVSGATTTNYSNLTVDITGIGAMRLQIGANEGQVLAIDIPAVTLQNLGIEEIDVTTQEGASDAIERLDGAIKTLSKIRGKLGAYQNRLESSINSLDVTSENMTSAYSRIMDVDMAEEMTNYTTYQVMTQAGTSMLAQANERPSQVLQLLQ